MTEDKQLPATQQPAPLSPMQNSGPTKASEKEAMARVSAEVYAAEQRAIFYPTDRKAAIQEMLELCDDITFASSALYKVPRGKDDAEGINVHAAHELTTLWGDMDSTLTFHGAYGEESQVTIAARDLQRNKRRAVTITVKHEREKGGGVEAVSSPTLIGDIVKAAAAKEERNCLLRLIPHHVRQEIIARCKRTIYATVQDIGTAWGAMTKVFGGVGVTPAALLRYLNKPKASIKDLTAADMVELKVLFQGCREDRSLLDEFFPDRDKSKTAKDDAAVAKIQTSQALLDGKTGPQRTRTTTKKTSEQSTSGSESEASQTNASESVQEKTEDAATLSNQQAAPTNAPAEAAPADTSGSPNTGSASSGEPDPTRLLTKEEYRALLDMVKNAKGMEPEEVQAWYIKRDPGAKGQRIVGLITFGDAQALREHLGLGA